MSTPTVARVGALTVLDHGDALQALRGIVVTASAWCVGGQWSVRLRGGQTHPVADKGAARAELVAEAERG